MIDVSITKPDFSVVGVYKEGKIIVKKGSSINPKFASYIKGITVAKKYREDKTIIDSEWTLKKDCEFPSPSTAAQFVMGQSRDGYDAWKVSDGKSLGAYLEERGLRERKRRRKE